MNEMNPAGIDHVSIAVGDLDAAVEFFTSVLGLQLAHEEINEREGVREAMLVGSEGASNRAYGMGAVQLISPSTGIGSQTGANGVANYLQQRGNGLHHLAIRVPDVTKAAEAARAGGVRVLSETPLSGTAGSTIVFLHPKDCFGVLIELVQSDD